MRRLIVCCVLLMMWGGSSRAASGEVKFKVEAEINNLLRQFTEAQKNYDAGVLDKILAPDYVEISPLGEVDPRAKVLGFYAPEKKGERGELVAYGLDEMTTRIYGDTAIVVARLPFTVKTPDGQTMSRALRCTIVCRKLHGKWLIASAQYTGIRPPAPSAQP